MELGYIFFCFYQQSVTLPELPAIVVFKDGGYFTYDGECSDCPHPLFGGLFCSVKHKKH